MSILKFLVCFFIRTWTGIDLKCDFECLVFIIAFSNVILMTLKYILVNYIAAFIGKYQGETFTVLPCSSKLLKFIWWSFRWLCFCLHCPYDLSHRLVISSISMMFQTFGTFLSCLGWAQYSSLIPLRLCCFYYIPSNIFIFGCCLTFTAVSEAKCSSLYSKAAKLTWVSFLISSTPPPPTPHKPVGPTS